MAKSDMSTSKSKKRTRKRKEISSYNTESVCLITTPARISTPVSLLIESLVKNICTIYESDSTKANHTYKLICDKLFKMRMIDESYDMAEFEGIRNQYQLAFLHLLNTSSSHENDKKLPIHPIWPSSDITNSHYLREFDETEYIANGGFGQVYKVRHKLDGIEYAVKKIPIRSEGIDSVRNYLSEVKTFSSINHSNIVQYKAAWLEIGAPLAIRNESDSSSSNSSGDSYHKNESHSFSNFDQSMVENSFQIDFRHSTSGVNKVAHRSGRRESVSEGGHGQIVCTLDFKELRKLRNKRTDAKWATLYIQMSLCQSTLKHWLEKRNEMQLKDELGSTLVPINGQVLRNNAVFEILSQLLKGLEYIHYKGIVHHDIKPSNIFIQLENGNIIVQLGDFGLACPLQSVRHSLAFGTKLYAAPEQLAGLCDKKSDMYSLGIVLLELVQNFGTDMERVENITELRKGNLPANLLAEQPQFAQIICELTLKNPEKRPDATTLLQRIDLTSNDSQIEKLQLQLAERDEEIMHLKELLRAHGIKSN